MINPEAVANMQEFYNFSLMGILRMCIYFALYSIVPLLIGFKCKKKLKEKVIAAIMVANSFIIYCIIIFTNIKLQLGLTPNMIAPCVAGIFYYSWLRIRMHGRLEGKKHRMLRERDEAKARKEAAAAAAIEAAAARAAAENAAEEEKAELAAAAIMAEEAAEAAKAEADAAMDAAKKANDDMYNAVMP